jgi:hypothetical protein
MTGQSPLVGDVSLGSSEALNLFHNSLLPATFANATRCSFYRDHLAEFVDKNLNLANWSLLPFVNKSQLRAAGSKAQVFLDVICNEVFTSGTSGQPFVTLKGDQEQKYIAQFFRHVFARDFERPLSRALEINNPYHGYLMSIPVPIHSHRIGIYDEGSFAYGREVLQRDHQDRGVEPACTLLVGLERALRAFTMEARQAQEAGSQINHKLSAIISYSQLLTKRWKKIHEEFWGCPVIDRFGLSEVFGGATLDTACGWWHFDPVCLPEVVGARSRTPISEGVGELVLTSLYPFQQVQPMIRYLTGDLVEVTHARSSRPETLAIRPLGRIRYAVPQPEGDDFLLYPSTILEVIDAVSDIQRLPRFRDSGQVTDPYAVGHPLYSVNYKTDRYSRQIITASIVTSGARDQETIKEIAEALVDASPALQTAIADGLAELIVVAVASLSPDLISHQE